MAFLFVAVGFIAGVLIVLARIEHEKNSSANSNQETKTAKTRSASVQRGTLYIWRDAKSGRVLGEWNGHPVTDPRTLPAEEQTAIAALLSDWNAALGVDFVPRPPVAQNSKPPVEEPIPAPARPAAPSPAAVTAGAVKAAPQMVEAMPAPAVPPFTAPRPAAPVPQPAPISQSAPAARLTPKLVDRKREQQATPAAPTSIVGQINQILQEQLEGTPLQTRGIRLVEDFKNGVIVQVGMERYPGIDTVQDPEVRAAIRAAVAEWERRSETPAR
jgi:hypothetical protein